MIKWHKNQTKPKRFNKKIFEPSRPIRTDAQKAIDSARWKAAQSNYGRSCHQYYHHPPHRHHHHEFSNTVETSHKKTLHRPVLNHDFYQMKLRRSVNQVLYKDCSARFQPHAKLPWILLCLNRSTPLYLATWLICRVHIQQQVKNNS